jgi:multidrug efflux system membrane fusion protein
MTGFFTCKPWADRLGALARLAVIAVLLYPASGCRRQVAEPARGEDAGRKTAVPVAVAKAVRKAVPLELHAVGTVEAAASVAVKSQVEGELTAVHFREGQEVKAGELLFTIDPRPYAAQVKQAEAALARDRVQLANARKQVARYGAVVDQGFVAEEQYDQLQTAVAALEASLQAGDAVLESARLRLGFCTIRSPLTGVAGVLKVDRGNIVKANDNDKPLVFINQVRPVLVAFALPERHLPLVRSYMAGGRLKVQAVAPGQEPEQGELSFIENSVDTGTGTILLRASFENPDSRLWPGQFVNVVLVLAIVPDATVVPAQALQTGQQGEYLFVVRSDQTVELRPVSVQRIIDGQAVIATGIAVDESVVTDGQLRLTAGASVRPATAAGQAAGAPEGGRGQPPAAEGKGA